MVGLGLGCLSVLLGNSDHLIVPVLGFLFLPHARTLTLKTLPNPSVFPPSQVKSVGKETFRLAQAVVDEIVLVTNDEICAAVKDMFEDTRSITEPSGALSIAGAKQWLQQTGCQGRTVVAVASGANMNFDRLKIVAERAGVGDKAEAMLATFIPEEKGSFRQFIHTLGDAGLARNVASRSITEFKCVCATSRPRLRTRKRWGLLLLKTETQSPCLLPLVSFKSQPGTGSTRRTKRRTAPRCFTASTRRRSKTRRSSLRS